MVIMVILHRDINFGQELMEMGVLLSIMLEVGFMVFLHGFQASLVTLCMTATLQSHQVSPSFPFFALFHF